MPGRSNVLTAKLMREVSRSEGIWWECEIEKNKTIVVAEQPWDVYAERVAIRPHHNGR